MLLYENLEFQKRYFPDIYSMYLDKNLVESELAITKEPNEDIVPKNEILILCDDFTEMLSKHLNLPFTLLSKIGDELNSVNTIVVNNCYIESYKKYHSKNLLELFYLHGYDTKHYNIVLMNKVDSTHLKRVIKVINTKGLDFFESRKLNKIEVLDLRNNVDKLKKILYKFESYYDIKDYVNNELYGVDYKGTTQLTNLIEGSYNSFLSLEICRHISNSIKDKKMSDNEYYKIIGLCTSEFAKESLKVLSTFIDSPNFNKNFIAVDIYLKIQRDFRSEIESFILISYGVELSKIIDENSVGLDIYMRLLSSSIVKIDDISIGYIEKMYSKITNVLEKVT